MKFLTKPLKGTSLYAKKRNMFKHKLLLLLQERSSPQNSGEYATKFIEYWWFPRTCLATCQLKLLCLIKKKTIYAYKYIFMMINKDSWLQPSKAWLLSKTNKQKSLYKIIFKTFTSRMEQNIRTYQKNKEKM